MAIETEKNNLNINQIIADKREEIVVEGDCIVPDIKPDIIELIGTSGVVNVYKKELGEGKIRIDGCVSTYIMYAGNGERGKETRSINHTLDFSQIISIQGINSEMDESVQVTIKNIECKIINERKINIRANMVFEIRISSNQNIQFVNDVKLKEIQKKEMKINVNSILGIGKTKTNVKENINVDSADNIAEILKINSQILNIDTKVSYNKILTKADINLKLMYSNEEGKINVSKAVFPIMGFIDMENINENNICEPEFCIKNMVIKPNGTQDHSISVDIEVEISVTAYENKEINIIQDLYSPCKLLKFENEKIKTIKNKMIYRGNCSINQKELLNIGNEKVYDVDTKIVPNDIKIVDNGIMVGGNVKFIIIHSQKELSGISNKVIESPFEYKIPCSGINKNATIRLMCNPMNENYNILPGGEVDFRLDLEFIANTMENVEITLINDVMESDKKINNTSNMVIYFTKPEDNLWEIAKKFNSTKEIIKESNDMKDENIIGGMQLFIPRYVN